MKERRHNYPEIIHQIKENGENLISLKEFVETKCNACQITVDHRFKSLEKASELAAENLKVRLDSLNEWRGQNRDERQHFISQEVYEARHQILVNKIESLQKFMYIGIGAVAVIEILFRFVIK